MWQELPCAPLYLNRPTATPGETPAQLLEACWRKELLWCAGAQLQRDADFCNKYEQLIRQCKFLLWGKKNLTWVFVHTSFSTTRCLIFGYFFLMVSIASSCSRCFFLPCYARQSEVQSFFFSGNLMEEKQVSCLCIYQCKFTSVNCIQQLHSPACGLFSLPCFSYIGRTNNLVLQMFLWALEPRHNYHDCAHSERIKHFQIFL